MRHAEGASAVRSVSVAPKRQRSPQARRPCGHTRSVTPTRTRPKVKIIF
ncbi:MAG: hypothetical protein NZ455_07960 [Bacteroidia bacterium]|nr:hypothetical protein [Bacteroidia bacterium]